MVGDGEVGQLDEVQVCQVQEVHAAEDGAQHASQGMEDVREVWELIRLVTTMAVIMQKSDGEAFSCMITKLSKER